MYTNAVLRLCTIVICVCLATSQKPKSGKASRSPHIIFILADDLGWNDVSFHGSPQIPTPNIDALAASGIILQRHYTSPDCTPSRTALLTGRYPSRTDVGYEVLIPAGSNALSLRFELLPQWLKHLGYSTHMVGKWHVGYKSLKHTPTWRGFDTFFGYYNGDIFYFNHTLKYEGHCGLDLWRNVGHSTKSVADLNGTYSTKAFTDEAKRIIDEHDVRKPLFLYVSHEAGHTICSNCTVEAPKENVDHFKYIANYNRTVLAGAYEVMDRSIGEVLAALQSRGMLADSLVVFTSDNGGGPLASPAVEYANAGSNWPLRGVKQEVWEGGVRTPAVLWSGRLSGSLPLPPSQQVVHMSDWAPTLYAAAGGDPKDLGDVDGRNLWDVLSTGKGNGRQEVLLEIEGKLEMAALISGRYKLISRPSGPNDPQLDVQVAPPQGQPPEDLDLDALVTSSAAWQALQNASIDAGGRGQSSPRPNWRQEATLNCSGNGNSANNDSAQSNFNPYDTVFVFDIFSDPCERNNLASSNTKLRDRLLKKLEAYRKTISPRPSKEETDERGYPEHHRCLWSPWIGVKQAPYQNCPC
ncbi:arylsulfatase B [Dermacentor silvarum]|uniref:arylsulfatase B n=1 Tax=Dermacentor silvarum TaxID=543639 RepID=UPI001899B22C|nr:arylsulfatase B [Dermacentor silvarum]